MNVPRILIPLVLVLAMVLAACGGVPAADDNATTASVAPESAASTAASTEAVASTAAPSTAAASGEPEAQASAATGSGASACTITAPGTPTTISYLGWPQTLMDAYGKEMQTCSSDNLTINLRTLDNSTAVQQMQLAFSGGGTSPYDIVQMANGSIATIGGQGWLLPLNDLVEKYRETYNLDDIPQSAWDAATFDGKILGVPVASNTLHMMYRTDLFEKYNIEPPTNYDEVIAACNTLKAEPGLTVPFATDLSAGWAWDIEFFHFLESYGGTYLNDDNSASFNTPEGVAALTKLKEVADACMGPTGLSLGYEAMVSGLQNGTIGFIQTWADQGPAMDDATKSNYVGTIGFAPAAAAKPGGPLASSTWNDFLAIPATTAADPDLAFQLIMEATRADVQKRLASEGLVLVAREEALGAEGAFRSSQAALTSINDGVGPTPNSAANPLAGAALGNYLPLVGTNELTPEEALAKAEADYIKEATAQGYLK